jgi:hypothetical protein
VLYCRIIARSPWKPERAGDRGRWGDQVMAAKAGAGRQTGQAKAVTVCDRVGSGADGVLPGEAGVAGETGVGADEGGAVLDGQGGEPGVVEVVAG